MTVLCRLTTTGAGALGWLACAGAPGLAATIGVPADHATVQAAIEAAAPGDTVMVSAGTYRERLRMKAGVAVRSAGDDSVGELGLARAEATVIDAAADGDQPGVTMAEGATLDGFTVTGVGSYDEASWARHHATYGEEQDHHRLGAQGAPAISASGIAHCTVRHNIVRHNGATGIEIAGADDLRVAPSVHANFCYRNMGAGIASVHGSTATIDANTCFENFHAGIAHRAASPLVTNNRCFDNIRAGIGISSGACPVVRANHCFRNRRAGIGIRSGHTTQPVVEANECHQNEMAGIGIRDGARPLVRDNRCFENRMAGIGTRDGAQPVIEGNECFDNQMSGIGSRLESAPVVRGNRCYRNAMAGIGAREGARPVVVDNDCFDNAMAGIGSREGAAPVVRGNRCYRNGRAGIGTQLGSRALVADNECFENKMAGIGMRHGSLAIIAHNHSHHNSAAGIGVRGADTLALLVGNRCLENQLVAVGVPDGATAYIHGNELARTGGGAPPIVALRGGSSAVVADNLIRGGGVAGVLVSGRATLVDNRFEGRGPDAQGSAIWLPFGGAFDVEATLVAVGNHCRGYRQLINAKRAHLTATANTTRDFEHTAVIAQQPASPPRVLGNSAVTDDPNASAAAIDGDPGLAADALIPTANAPPADPDPTPRWIAAGRSDASHHPLAGSGQQRTVSDGPWKLVATYGDEVTYALYHTGQDPDEQVDRSAHLEQITFRMRGLLERQHPDE